MPSLILHCVTHSFRGSKMFSSIFEPRGKSSFTPAVDLYHVFSWIVNLREKLVLFRWKPVKAWFTPKSMSQDLLHVVLYEAACTYILVPGTSLRVVLWKSLVTQSIRIGKTEYFSIIPVWCRRQLLDSFSHIGFHKNFVFHAYLPVISSENEDNVTDFALLF